MKVFTDRDGHEVWVDPSLVAAVEVHGSMTRLHLLGGTSIYARETVNDVVTRLGWSES